MLSYNNHFKYLWDNKPFYFSERNEYSIQFRSDNKNLSFRDACIVNARFIGKEYQKPNLFLSGGLDSQIACLSFVLADIPVNIKIFKFKDDINHFDVKTAIDLCNSYSLCYDIIDIDIVKFLSNDLWYYADQFNSGCLHYSLLSKILYDFKDSVNIFGLGDFDFKFSNIRKIYYCYEYEYVGRFSLLHDNYIRFYQYSPEIINSWLKSQEVMNFISNKNGLDWDNYKNIFYKSHFPEISERKKFTGYEPIQSLIDQLTLELWSKNSKFTIRRPYTYNNYLEAFKYDS